MFRTALAGLAATVCALAAGPNSCTPIPVQWTVFGVNQINNQTSLLTEDGKGTYINNQSGVSATIACNQDAILALDKSTRSVVLNFTQPLYTDSHTPAGLTGKAITANSVNVRNILYLYSATTPYTFTTTLSVSPINIGWFRMLSLAEAASPQTADFPMANNPNMDALVNVRHCPANSSSSTCPASSHETWYVYPVPTSQTDPPSVGTLIVNIGKGNTVTDVNAGQFAMPFYFVISKLN